MDIGILANAICAFLSETDMMKQVSPDKWQVATLDISFAGALING